ANRCGRSGRDAASAAVRPRLPQLPTGVVEASASRNLAEEVEAFMDLGLGLFIHWGVDVQYGAVISHSLVGADESYLRRFFNDLPKTFNPRDYEPQRWAELARACGFKYAVLTAKHHSGFCLFPTATTTFDIESSRYGKDLVGPYMKAFRDEGLKAGLYFSPEDFYFLHAQGHPPARAIERGFTQLSQNPDLDDYCRRQVAELCDAYDPVDLWFFDSLEPPESLKELVWDRNPRTLVTRGAMTTPEQTLGDVGPGQPWEACYTMGDQWQYRGVNENYKTGRQLIQILVETRARGGNLLLNVGPDSYGRIPLEQESLLRELGLWLFINGEAIYGVRPWHVTHEDGVWFTQAKDGSAVYAILSGQTHWPLGERRTVRINSLALSEDSQISVLGHGGRILEYEPDVDPSPTARQAGDAVEITVMRAQRIYNDRKWPNPVVVKITHPQVPLR
ncbi:MAG TPA: alpha-L-fucosidase, partial [Lacipirellulaceae bacterium]|nr:alpha-L-fucosidase [Lacipirellulaceae bacterium]